MCVGSFKNFKQFYGGDSYNIACVIFVLTMRAYK